MESLTRRRFMTLTEGAGAAALTASLLPRSLWANPMGLPIGIQLYTVSKPMQEDTAGTLKELHTIGYRQVETAGLGKFTAQQLRTMIDDAGLVCPSAHLQLTGTDLDAQFAAAHALGAHFAVSSVLLDFHRPPRTPGAPAQTPPAPPRLGPLGLDGFKRMAAHMNEVGTKAHAAGLQYAYHNHNFEFETMPDGQPGYNVLLNETDKDLVKFEIDCGWMVVAGSDPVAYMKKYPGRFRMLHIKDFKPVAKPTTDLMGAGRPKGTDLGTGFVQYKPIFAAGKAAGIEHIFVEQESPFPVSQMDSAKVDYAYLTKFK